MDKLLFFRFLVINSNSNIELHFEMLTNLKNKNPKPWLRINWNWQPEFNIGIEGGSSLLVVGLVF